MMSQQIYLQLKKTSVYWDRFSYLLDSISQEHFEEAEYIPSPSVIIPLSADNLTWKAWTNSHCLSFHKGDLISWKRISKLRSCWDSCFGIFILTFDWEIQKRIKNNGLTRVHIINKKNTTLQENSFANPFLDFPIIKRKCVVPENIHTPTTEDYLICTPHPSGFSVPGGSLMTPPLPLGISRIFKWGPRLPHFGNSK